MKTGLRRGCKGRVMSVRCGMKDPQGGRAQACLQTAHPDRDECSLCRHLFEGVFSAQTYACLGHIALSVPMLGAGQLGNIQCKKPHETRFLRSVTAALPMSDPPCPPEAYGSNFVDLPRLVHERLLVFRVCHLTQLRHPDYRVWSGKACRADHGLSHHTDGTHTQRSHGNEAPALRSQLLRLQARAKWCQVQLCITFEYAVSRTDVQMALSRIGRLQATQQAF